MIFTDIEGVLFPGVKPTFSQMSVFEELMRECGNPPVIITSGWRLHQTIKEIRNHFPEHLRHRIEGVTPEKDAINGPVRRQEVESYAKMRPGSYVVLDDDPSLFGGEWSPLIEINPQTGLVRSDIPVIKSRLLQVRNQTQTGANIRPRKSMIG